MSLNLTNIQGDILAGLPKKTETFYFFQISDPGRFRKQLLEFVPLVKTVAQVLEDRAAIRENKRQAAQKGAKPELIPMASVNIAFSQSGLKKIGITDDLKDEAFAGGQLKDAEDLGDKGIKIGSKFEPDWDRAFKHAVHGVILVAGDSHASVDKKLHEIEHIFRVGGFHHSIHEVARIRGDVRPGEVSAHEHFGFLDGISNPSIIGFDKNPPPGPKPVRQGAILVGREGDEQAKDRPTWAVDGSFLVFRHLLQIVPEFNSFIKHNPIVLPGLTREQGSELLGARMVGRWKSGAPIDLTPLHDDKTIAADPNKINDFRFAGQRNDQTRCPFAAHIRKTLPRADLEDFGTPPISLESRRIMRRGIQFGPEVTRFEQFAGRTHHDRGLLFACYQSSIVRGFQFMQKSWANSQTFPFTEQTPAVPGIDPIIGQTKAGETRAMSGTNPNDPVKNLGVPQWVFPRGGEYFFSPSMKALKDTIASEDDD